MPLLSKKHNIPVYTCIKTKDYLDNYLAEKKTSATIHGLEYDQTFNIKNLEITTFETSHDAVMPCGFYISNGGQSLTFATDLGYVSDKILEYLNKADSIVLESNYDNVMLEYGKYPYNVKKRIASDLGHLSNEDTASILSSVLTVNPDKKCLLSHLSENNNTVHVANDTITNYLKDNGINTFDINFATPDLSCKGYII